MEGGISGWNAGTQASSVAQSNGTTDPAHVGSFSLKVTRNAVAQGFPQYLCITSLDFPVAASTQYYFWCWAHTTTASGSLSVYVNYYQADGTTYISEGSIVSATSVPASTWTQLGPVQITTPALAGYVRVIPISESTYTTGNVIFLDDFFMGRLLVYENQLIMPQSVNRSALF